MSPEPRVQTSTHEVLLAQTFQELADVLIDSFDVIEVLTMLVDRTVQLFDIAATGLLLADKQGRLRLIAASSEEIRLLELFQVQNDEGPCLDSFKMSSPVIADSIHADGRWPKFAEAATSSDLDSVLAVPLKLRGDTLGAMGLFQRKGAQGASPFLPVVESLAAVASLTILQDQAANHSDAVVVELQHALDSRVVIEQAKGMIAEYTRGDHADMDKAFDTLRSHARSHRRRLTEVASDVVSGALSLEALAGTPKS